MTVRLVSSVLLGLALCLGLSLCVGCGGDNPLGRQAVSGVVTLNGEPVANGDIRFVTASKGPTNGGATIADGKYAISAERGLVPGDYVVNITVPDPNWSPKNSLNPKDIAPAEYASGTAHKVTVAAGGTNTFDFDMTGK